MPPESTAAPLRVVHFVSGGGAGSTRVALDLALAQAQRPDWQPHLILRSKGRPLQAVMQRQVEQVGLPLHWVPNLWPRSRVMRRIEELCEQIRPTVFFAHGYSEHLWGRRAALRQGVPLLVHVEHNVERYLPWRVRAARRLAARTQVTVCVSSAVEQDVRRLGIGGQRIVTVHNGVDAERYRCQTPLAGRAADILMPARFARNKDQPTLIRAVRLLLERGWRGRLLLAGGGKRWHRRRCERLVATLGLSAHVLFLGKVDDLPERLAQCRVAALASWREGFGLVLVEAMSAGCAVVASAIPGITDVLHGDGADANGWLFPPGDPVGAANALWQALSDDAEAQRRADAGQRNANGHFSLAAMVGRYDEVVQALLQVTSPTPPAGTLPAAR
jgi:glycosyltransferase involved in cell wall biosynthesis